MSHAYASSNRATGLAASAFTPGAGPSDATRSYLNDARLDKTYSFTANASGNTLVIDFGSARSLVAFAVLNHNLATATAPTLKVEAADDAAITVGAVTPKAQTSLNQSFPFAQDHVLQFAAVSKRYWRLTWTWTGTFTLTVGEIFAATTTTALPRKATYGSQEKLDLLTIPVQMEYGDSRYGFLGGPVRTKVYKFADLSLTDRQALQTMWRATLGPVLPFLWVESYEATGTAAAVAEQEVMYGRQVMPSHDWTQEDYGVYQTPDIIIRSMGRDVGN